MVSSPFPQSFWVHEGLLCAGCYPGDLYPATRDAKLSGLIACGIRRVVSLMEANERSRGGRLFEPYMQRLHELTSPKEVCVECLSLPIPDARAPLPAALQEILELIERGLREEIPTYLHCWGGHGRTGTVVACHLIQQGCTAQEAIDKVLALRAGLPKNHYPFEGDQECFIRSWHTKEVKPRGLS